MPCATASLVACERMPNRNQSRAGRPSIGKCFTFFLSLCINNSARGLKEARSDAGEVTCSRPELVPPHGVVHAPFAVGNRVGEGGRGGVLISEMFEGCSAVFTLRLLYYAGDMREVTKGGAGGKSQRRRIAGKRPSERVELQWSCASIARLAPRLQSHDAHRLRSCPTDGRRAGAFTFGLA